MPYKKSKSGKYVRDTEGRITLHRREEYRLWFEYLKRATKPNKKYYKDWGDYSNLSFKEWWNNHWLDLFAEPDTGDAVIVSGNKPKTGFIRIDIPIYQDVDKSIAEVRAILKNERAQSKAAQSRAKCQITEGAKINRRWLRNFLRAYDLKEKGYKRDEVASIMWNERLEMIERQKKTKRNPENYAAKLTEFNPSNDIENIRRSVSRYIQKAKKIIANVECGEFPGKY